MEQKITHEMLSSAVMLGVQMGGFDNLPDDAITLAIEVLDHKSSEKSLARLHTMAQELDKYREVKIHELNLKRMKSQLKQ